MKKNEIKNIVTSYRSVSEWVRKLQAAPVSSIFKARGHLSSEDGSASYRGTQSWDDAQSLLARGDKENFEAIKSASKAFKIPVNGTLNRSVIREDYVGFMPCVPAAVLGFPKSMYNTERVDLKGRVISVAYFINADCYETASSIRDAGRKLAAALYSAEASGVRVNLWVGMSSEGRNERLITVVRIKDANQRTNLLKMAYPLCNPSFLRRHLLREIEQCEGLGYDFTNGYGAPVGNKTLLRTTLEAKGIKCQHLFTYSDLQQMPQSSVNAMLQGKKV